MSDYSTQGVINAELYDAAGAESIVPKRVRKSWLLYKWFWFVCALICVIFGFLGLGAGAFLGAAILVAFGIYAHVRLVPSMKENVLSDSKARFLESVPSGSLEMKTAFEEDGVKCWRLDCDAAPSFISYEDIDCVSIFPDNLGKDRLVGVSRTGNIFFAFISELSDSDKVSLREMIENKDVSVEFIVP